MSTQVAFVLFGRTLIDLSFVKCALFQITQNVLISIVRNIVKFQKRLQDADLIIFVYINQKL